MQSTAYDELQARARQLAALPLPRTIGPAFNYKRLAILATVPGLFLIVEFIRQGIRSSNLDQVNRWNDLILFAILFSFMFIGQFFMNSGPRKILMWGTPVVGRVLSVRTERKGAQVEYSYSISSGETVHCDGFVLGGQELKRGLFVTVCYQPDRPERSVLVDYSALKIEFPSETKLPA